MSKINQQSNQQEKEIDRLKKELFQTITSLTSAKRLWVGYSGGLDSHVLLDLVANTFQHKSDYQVAAIHVNHGLSTQADTWVDHCEAVCTALQVPLSIIWTNVSTSQGESVEEAAREARFKAFSEVLQAEDCLLLAHHAEDQAETILMRLFRGAGPTGLGGMVERVEISGVEIVRPLLAFSKESLEVYAKSRNLQWIQDESNQNLRFDRNFLRHEIIPRLKARWPRVVRSVSRSGALCLETSTAVQVMAAQDLVEVAHKTKPAVLLVKALLSLEPTRRKHVIRYWIQQQNFALPSREHLERIDREILQAKAGAKPLLKIDNYLVQRCRGELLVTTL